MGGLSYEEATRRIRDAGLRVTPPRVEVLQLLARSKGPLSHSQVVMALKSDTWDQATLYRNLVKLVAAGLARVTSKLSGAARYEVCRDDEATYPHPHFYCRACGAVACLPAIRLVGSAEARWRPSLEQAELQIFGNCPGCLERRT